MHTKQFCIVTVIRQWEHHSPFAITSIYLPLAPFLPRTDFLPAVLGGPSKSSILLAFDMPVAGLLGGATAPGPPMGGGVAEAEAVLLTECGPSAAVSG